MPYLGLKVKDRNKGKPKFPSPCRYNQMICAINCCQDATRQANTKVKPPFLPYDEPNLCNDYILKDLVCIERFYISSPCDCVLNQVDSDTDLLNNVVLMKDILRPTKNSRSVGSHKL